MNKFVFIQPYLSLNGKITKNINWKINSVGNYYFGNNQNRKIINISPRLEYLIDKFELFINTNNILNLKSQEILNNSAENGIFNSTITSTLPGFINLGIKYNF
jgi:hypothetical protein